MFLRPRHLLIAQVLTALDAPLLSQQQCLFGGGTAMVLRHGEYRESLDIDFLVSDLASYRFLRQLFHDRDGFPALLRPGMDKLFQPADFRADQYGIRTQAILADTRIKFQLVLEGRIVLAAPGNEDQICGVSTLTPLDMAAGKLLANSDRWRDDGVFSRDIIDLAMMSPSRSLLMQAIEKAEGAYGNAIRMDLIKALDQLRQRSGWLDRCMAAMGMTMPKALLWKHLRRIGAILR
jgi:hypothetical protein